jgi:hypothetical protein
MKATKYILTALTLASALHCANASADNLVVNGGFEDDVNGWSMSTSGNGFTTVSTVYIYDRGEGTLHVSTFGFPGSMGLPDESRNAAWLGCGYSTGCTPGVNEASWSQTLNTVAGQSYSLSFQLGAAYGSTSVGTGTVDVLWNGVKIGGQSFAGTEDTPYGTSYQIGNLVAQGQDVLQFRTASGTVIGLDGVNVSAVPEPTTYAMLAAGLTLLGLRRRMGKTRD